MAVLGTPRPCHCFAGLERSGLRQQADSLGEGPCIGGDIGLLLSPSRSIGRGRRLTRPNLRARRRS